MLMVRDEANVLHNSPIILFCTALFTLPLFLPCTQLFSPMYPIIPILLSVFFLIKIFLLFDVDIIV